MTTELATQSAMELMPAFSIEGAVDRYNRVLEFTQKIMKPGKDYGAIPGTDKPTLLKPGAEKLCSFFGLALDYQEVEKVCDWNSGFFFFTYKAVLSRHGEIVATGIGSCNTKEKKYRWRNADRKCPKCGAEAILKSKDKPEFFCWRKKNGCGAVFSDRDPAITGQTAGKVENTETFDLVNTIQKMAQKRALVAATLVAANASEFYTQDVEDMQMIDADYTVVESVAVETTKQTTKQTTPTKCDPARSAELIRLCKLKKVPGEKVTEWLAKAKADSFDDCKPETVEYLIGVITKMPTPAPLKQSTPAKHAADDYDTFIAKCESAAQETGLTSKELFTALSAYMKANETDAAKLGEDGEDQVSILKLIAGRRGYFTPSTPVVAEGAAA